MCLLLTHAHFQLISNVFYSKASDRIGKANEDIFHQGTQPFVLKKNILKLIGQSRDKRLGTGRWVNLYHMNYAWRLNWQHCPYEYQKSQRQYVPWKLFSESPSLMYILFTVISRLRSLRRSIRIFCCIMYQETLDILTRGLSPECSRGFFFFFAFIAQCLLCIIKVKNGINTDIQNFKQREKK